MYVYFVVFAFLFFKCYAYHRDLHLQTHPFPTRRASDREDSAAIAGRAARREDVGDVSAVNLVPDDLRGLDRYEARARVVEAITAEGLAVTDAEGAPVVDAKPIMQPFGDRSGQVIEPFLTDQWFRSEEHTSELQSLMRISYAVFCLKKKKKYNKQKISRNKSSPKRQKECSQRQITTSIHI